MTVPPPRPRVLWTRQAEYMTYIKNLRVNCRTVGKKTAIGHNPVLFLNP